MDPPQYPLLAAAEVGDQATVAQLLNTDADPNERTPEGWTALIMAAKGGHKEIVTQLLMADAEVNPPREGKWVDPKPPESTHTALRGASIMGQLAVVKLLLENEADPNIVSAGSRTPLMGAAMNGHHDVVTCLLENGASPSAVNTFGETARAIAEEKGHAAIAGALREREAAAVTPSQGSQGLSVGQAAEMMASFLEANAQVTDKNERT